jgi:hypothetical protein
VGLGCGQSWTKFLSSELHRVPKALDSNPISPRKKWVGGIIKSIDNQDKNFKKENEQKK